jgi:hypothetical protein
MAINNIPKALSLISELQQNLELRLGSSFYYAMSQDQNGAILVVSQSATPVAGQQNIAIRCEGVPTQFSDSLGNPQSLYSPMRFQVIEESSTISGVSLLTLLNRVQIDIELARAGVLQERYLNANGTPPTASQFDPNSNVDGSTLIILLPNDVSWPLSGQ